MVREYMPKPADKDRKKLIKPELPGGFRDVLPSQMIAKQKMMEAIRGVFEKFGFDPMETPAVERTDVLITGDKESDKIIFRVAPAVRGEVKDTDRDEASLRFDLTVPLARVLAANPDIPKPFKRYQIGNVWRGERSQFGRYKEFTQMDIDILGVKSADADAEVIQVMYEAMKTLGIDNFKIRLNDKEEMLKLLDEFGIPENNRKVLLIAVDKKDKLSPDKWKNEVIRASGISPEAAEKYLWKISGENMLETTKIKALREKVEKLGVPQKYLIYDTSLVRGFGYYTGSVFETVLTDIPEIGSVFSGGRFDGLTSRFSRESWPAVGASVGVDRLLAALEKLGKIKKQATLVQVLVLNLSPELASDYSQVLKNLRIEKIRSMLYIGDDMSFQNQLAYAVKKEIPFVLIYGEKEKLSGNPQIKDLRKETQEAVAKEKLAEYIKNRL